jgi:4-hydroxybenzoyl-CoA thioesterase
VEDWFTQGLGVNYANLLGPRRIGLPMVSLQADFKAPSRMGETIALQLQLARKGRRSLTLQVRCIGTDNENDTVRWTAQAVIVTTSLAHDGAIDIPQDVHEGVARWQMLSGETP